MNVEKVCGTCRYNKHDGEGFYCACEHSDNFTDYTKYGDSCDEWEAKAMNENEKR